MEIGATAEGRAITLVHPDANQLISSKFLLVEDRFFSIFAADGKTLGRPACEACLYLQSMLFYNTRSVFVNNSESWRRSGRSEAFSLLELLVVMAIMVVMMALMAPAFIQIKGAGDVTKAAYDVAGVLENARAYATANNTYVWVGFFEEDQSKTDRTAGVGRIVLSVVASKDGTVIYTASAAIDPTRLVQINKPVKIDNVHLKTAGATFPIGTGTGTTFDTRPAVDATDGTAQIGDTSPPDSQTPFQYPVGSPAPTAQYTFKKAIQFSPRGEASVTSFKAPATKYQPRAIVEIGLQPTHGNAVDVNSKNVVAVQVTGIVSNVKIYRR